MNPQLPVIYLMGCACPHVFRMAHYVEDLKKIPAKVCVILSPTAAVWLHDQLPLLTEITGYPVRTSYKLPTDPDALPPADFMICPAITFNTINKWAAGICDTLILGLLTESLGMPIPKIIIPCINNMQAQHPQFTINIHSLKTSNVTVIGQEEDSYDWSTYTMIDNQHHDRAWNTAKLAIYEHLTTKFNN